VRGYLDLIKSPYVLRLTAFQLLARLPLGMLSLAILLHVSARTGSYALAGAVVACMSIAEAVAMPLSARCTGMFGVAPVVGAAATVNAAAMVGLALGPAHPVLMAALGAVVGASIPPLMPVVRALYPRMVPAEVVRTLFAFDTTAQEMIWVVGPVAVTVLASVVSTALPLLAAAAVTVLGSIGFVLSLGRRHAGVDRNTSPFGRVLLQREVILALIANLALVGSFMALEVGLVAHLSRTMAGAAISVSSVGSLIGGIALGHRRLGIGGLVALLGIVAAGTALIGVVAGPLQFVVLFAAGFGFAPSMATLYVMVSRGVAEHAASEAFGWLNTGSLVGGAIGTALAGVATAGLGARGAFVVATLLASVAVVAPLIVRSLGPIAGLGVHAPLGVPTAAADVAG
jgi:MFS family permease